MYNHINNLVYCSRYPVTRENFLGFRVATRELPGSGFLPGIATREIPHSGFYMYQCDTFVKIYYDDVFKRIPWVKEDKQRIKDHQILVDSQKQDSYLLQIFTKNIFGPIFIEMIQRVDDSGFGEGNFTALFKSIELNQMEKGTVK